MRATRASAGEGLAYIAVDCVSTDQSDCTGAIRLNFIHDSDIHVLVCLCKLLRIMHGRN